MGLTVRREGVGMRPCASLVGSGYVASWDDAAAMYQPPPQLFGAGSDLVALWKVVATVSWCDGDGGAIVKGRGVGKRCVSAGGAHVGGGGASALARIWHRVSGG